MAKVTRKLQVTLPKAIAEQYGIRPGDELDCVPAGDSIRIAAERTRLDQSPDCSISMLRPTNFVRPRAAAA
jgi:AbrB family looped-hinge helix DNA binding protein